MPAIDAPPSTVRWRALRYTITFLVPLGALGTFLGHTSPWLIPAFSFGLVPLLDVILSSRHRNLSAEEERCVLDDPLFDILLYLFVPIQFGLLYLFLLHVTSEELEVLDLLGSIATMGILCGVYGINVAHELGHRSKRWERDMARALLLTSLYMHFIIEHNRGHHRRVATEEDPASARYNETIYAFWMRSLVFSWVSAWRIEVERLRRLGRSPYGLGNEMIRSMVLQLGLLAAIGMLFGTRSLLAFVAAAFIGMLLLETVNYIEHYGLRRVQKQDGGYHRVEHAHSWNSDHLMGRILLFELTRHSDHHYKASKKYQVLKSLENAPQLPTGYPGMMLLSLIPPLFFAVMDPRLHTLVRDHAHVELARS